MAIIIFKMSSVQILLEFNYRIEKKVFYHFVIKSKTWFNTCVVDSDPKRSCRLCFCIYFDLILITLLIKTIEKSHWNKKYKKLHPFLKINTSFVSQKIQISFVLCRWPQARNNTSVIGCVSFVYDLWVMAQ